MSTIINPIIRGFNPDPSIIRVGEDYYIATSTFEWFPGVQIHHSKDLVNWELIARPLNRKSQLDMVGNPDSCGVWAPCLSYDDGVFYLLYSNVRSFDGVWKDTPNYLVTTEDILGPWSDPIFINSSGFDASLFHDADGKKWYTSMMVDHRKGKFFGDILLQEYDIKKHKLIGEEFQIFKGSELGFTEGPHLYRRNGYYYLITAEGGTEYGHAVSFARSKNIEGPYLLHPTNPLISSREFPKAALQKCGHGDLVETQNGEWYCVFLTGRPLSFKGRCTLGRETAIAKMQWKDDDWLYMEGSSPHPSIVVSNALEQEIEYKAVQAGKVDFKSGELDINFQSLRVPISEEWCSLKVRPGYLRLYGRESLNSFHYQSLLARRVQAFKIEASLMMDYVPTHYQQLAGLICYYNTSHWFYLSISGDEDGISRYIQIIRNDNFKMEDVLKEKKKLDGIGKVHLKVQIKMANLQFYYSLTGKEWLKIGPILDASILSDDYVRDGSERYRPAFTGAFVGMCCQDLTGGKMWADFESWEYKEIDIIKK